MILLDEGLWEMRTSKEKGRGIYAKKDIPAGIVLGDYIGRVIRIKDEEKYETGDHFYLMYYHRAATIYPDPKKPGVHIINHSCTPNTWMHTYRGHTLYFALRRIFAGEELTVSYNLAPLDKDCDPCTHLCHCKSIICSNTMHMTQEKSDRWNEFEEAQAQKTVRESVKINKMLPLLDSYPENIPDHPIYTLFGNPKKEAYRMHDKVLPSKSSIRERIRETGQTIIFPALKIHVLGVTDDLIVSTRVD